MCQILQPRCQQARLVPPCRAYCRAFHAGCGARLPDRLRPHFDCARFPDYFGPGSCAPEPGRFYLKVLETRAVNRYWNQKRFSVFLRVFVQADLQRKKSNLSIYKSKMVHDLGITFLNIRTNNNKELICSITFADCRGGLQRLALSRRSCDGVPDCADAADERGCAHCAAAAAGAGAGARALRCALQPRCLPPHLRCDGTPDCPDGSDESGCCKYYSRNR